MGTACGGAPAQVWRPMPQNTTNVARASATLGLRGAAAPDAAWAEGAPRMESLDVQNLANASQTHTSPSALKELPRGALSAAASRTVPRPGRQAPSNAVRGSATVELRGKPPFAAAPER
mmetsp:Transcript_149086/g.477476  ORF Transcript_149086/g.477476 Transcript_149086/m.477476 type:complete len:119 (-) Transcript_149086:229-585(-)